MDSNLLIFQEIDQKQQVETVNPFLPFISVQKHPCEAPQ